MPPDEPVVAAVEQCLDRRVSAGQRLVVGYSGGLDSTVLLHILRRLTGPRGIALGAIHVNHGLSVRADTWQAHCVEVCADWDVPLSTRHVVVERGSADGLEAAARRARHAEFQTTEADWVVLAHHGNDQAETMLFNLLRGAGVTGARGMLETNGRLLRPLLDIERIHIEDYAKAHGLGWIEDESNADRRLSRNHIRHEVLAGLEARFPGSTANLSRAARRFAESRELLDALAVGDLGGGDVDFPLAVDRLGTLGEPRARNALRFLLQRRSVPIPSEDRLREAVAQMLDAAPDRHPRVVFGGHTLRRRKGFLVLESQAD